MAGQEFKHALQDRGSLPASSAKLASSPATIGPNGTSGRRWLPVRFPIARRIHQRAAHPPPNRALDSGRLPRRSPQPSVLFRL